MKADFGSWLRASTKRSVALYVAAATCLLNILVSSDRLSRALPEAVGVVQALNKQKDFLAPGLNFIVIAILVAVLSGRIHTKAAFPEAAESVTRFRAGWLIVWILWGLIYLLELGITSVKYASPATAGAEWYQTLIALARNFINDIQTVALISSYLILLQPAAGRQVAGRGHRYARGIMIWPTGFLVVASLIAVQGLCEGLRWEVSMERELFSLAGFSFGGLALALFVSRLESRYIAVPLWVTAALYFYALLQPIYGIAEHTTVPHLEVFVMALALPLKLLLFGVVYWLLRTTRLQFYFETARLADLDLPARWKAFEEA